MNIISKSLRSRMPLLTAVIILGFLAVFCFIYINSTKSTSYDDLLKSKLSNIRTEANIYYNTLNNFGTVKSGPSATACFKDDTIFKNDVIIARQLGAAQAYGGGLSSCANTIGSGGRWAIIVQLKSDPTVAWCVDSVNNSKQVSLESGTQQIELDDKIKAAFCP